MNNREKYYNSFGLDKTVPYNFVKKQEINNLFAIPKRETAQESPHFYNFEENNTHQADILFLPWDTRNGKTYAYALIVVDVATGKTDGEPLEKNEPESNKKKGEWNGPKSEDVVKAFKAIYNRKTFLKQPTILTTDSGREFTEPPFQKYIKDNNISWKKAVRERHRQVGLVERRNYTIGRAIMMHQFAQEQLTQKPSTEWLRIFPDVIKEVNKRFDHKPYSDDDLNKKYGDPMMNKTSILPIGTRVRIMLTEPKDFKERRVHGSFRAGDHRWTQDIYKIKGYIIDPHQPVLYKLNKKLKDHEKAAFVRQELKVVKNTEEDAPRTLVPENSMNDFAINRIIDKRTNPERRNRVEYLIRWKGYGPEDDTWENKRESAIPQRFIDDYEGLDVV